MSEATGRILVRFNSIEDLDAIETFPEVGEIHFEEVDNEAKLALIDIQNIPDQRILISKIKRRGLDVIAVDIMTNLTLRRNGHIFRN